jgi:hypothetical protein
VNCDTHGRISTTYSLSIDNETGDLKMNTRHARELLAANFAAAARLAAAKLAAAERERIALRAAKAERYNTADMPLTLKVQAE